MLDPSRFKHFRHILRAMNPSVVVDDVTSKTLHEWCRKQIAFMPRDLVIAKFSPASSMNTNNSRSNRTISEQNRLRSAMVSSVLRAAATVANRFGVKSFAFRMSLILGLTPYMRWSDHEWQEQRQEDHRQVHKRTKSRVRQTERTRHLQTSSRELKLEMPC